MTATIVRTMTPADFSAALDMWVAAWQAAYPAIDFSTRRDWAKNHIASLEQQGSLSSIAVSEGQIVGLLVIDPNTGYLDQIVVATQAQGGDAAKLLIEKARATCPGGIDLHVNADNTRAIEFYRKNGFVVSGADKNARSGAPTHKMSWRP
jgi:putative acetyltransferase